MSGNAIDCNPLISRHRISVVYFGIKITVIPYVHLHANLNMSQCVGLAPNCNVTVEQQWRITNMSLDSPKISAIYYIAATWRDPMWTVVALMPAFYRICAFVLLLKNKRKLEKLWKWVIDVGPILSVFDPDVFFCKFSKWRESQGRWNDLWRPETILSRSKTKSKLNPTHSVLCHNAVHFITGVLVKDTISLKVVQKRKHIHYGARIIPLTGLII